MSEKFPDKNTQLTQDELAVIKKILEAAKDVEAVGATPIADQSEEPLHTAQNSPTPDPTAKPRGPENVYPPRPPQGL